MTWMPQRKFLRQRRFFLFEFELFVGVQCQKERAGNYINLPALIYLLFRFYMSRPCCSIVYANIVNQAGEVRSSFHVFTTADVEAIS